MKLMTLRGNCSWKHTYVPLTNVPRVPIAEIRAQREREREIERGREGAGGERDAHRLIEFIRS